MAQSLFVQYTMACLILCVAATLHTLPLSCVELHILGLSQWFQAAGKEWLANAQSLLSAFFCCCCLACSFFCFFLSLPHTAQLVSSGITQSKWVWRVVTKCQKSVYTLVLQQFVSILVIVAAQTHWCYNLPCKLACLWQQLELFLHLKADGG